ncbi:hypothetical protein Asp14428_20000 [Actinoplanes sp. NBRC 14428]|nr:hypothetical protein Asp14428_20000 [Actinoplanes sp. NBRC 14428]
MRFTVLAAALAAAVSLTVLPSLPAAAAEPEPGPAAGKIETTLKDRFRTQPATDFWIRFRTGADLKPAKKIADWTARGRFVHDALAAVAKDSVASVAPELDRAGVKYASYPIANAVLVRNGSEKLALGLASQARVAEIHAAPQAALVDPVDEKVPGDRSARPAAPRPPVRTTA